MNKSNHQFKNEESNKHLPAPGVNTLTAYWGSSQPSLYLFLPVSWLPLESILESVPRTPSKYDWETYTSTQKYTNLNCLYRDIKHQGTKGKGLRYPIKRQNPPLTSCRLPALLFPPRYPPPTSLCRNAFTTCSPLPDKTILPVWGTSSSSHPSLCQRCKSWCVSLSLVASRCRSFSLCCSHSNGAKPC